MFGKSEEVKRRKSGGVVGLFRLFLSLIMMFILAVGLYLAYRNFSGYDPLKLDPESIVKSVLASESVYLAITNLLSFSPDKSLSDKITNFTSSEVKQDLTPKDRGEIKFKFAVIADSHKDYQSLEKALNQAKEENVKFIIGIGDFSDVGTIDELLSSKKYFDRVNIPYYLTPGDHDLWDSRNLKKAAESNFRQVFNSAPYQSFSDSGVRILIFYNSDNYQGLDSVQLKWLEDQFARISTEEPDLLFVFASTPLYHPSSDHVMGKVEPKLKDQADHLLSIFQKSAVDEVFFADTHFFSRYSEPTTSLKITTVGAVTSDRNPQSSRFALVDVYEDGSYNVNEVNISSSAYNN